MADSESRQGQTPWVPLAAIAAMVAFALVMVSGARLLGLEAGEAAPPAVVERELRFNDLSDGRVEVVDEHSGRRLAMLHRGEDGFIRATVRGLAQQRLREGADADRPFVLSGRRDGRVFLDDPVTGRRIDITAFGHTNAGAFARLLQAPGVRPSSPYAAVGRGVEERR